MTQLVHTMFISNNHASFRFWCRENLVKYQKASKHYENDCGLYCYFFRNIIFFGWAIDHFKELVHDDKLFPDKFNMFHIKFIYGLCTLNLFKPN